MIEYDWLADPLLWVVIGLVLIILEVFLGNMVLLPIGVAAFITALAIFANQGGWITETPVLGQWEFVVGLFAVASIISTSLIRFVFQRDDEPDINDY